MIILMTQVMLVTMKGEVDDDDVDVVVNYIGDGSYSIVVINILQLLVYTYSAYVCLRRVSLI